MRRGRAVVCKWHAISELCTLHAKDVNLFDGIISSMEKAAKNAASKLEMNRYSAH